MKTLLWWFPYPPKKLIEEKKENIRINNLMRIDKFPTQFAITILSTKRQRM